MRSFILVLVFCALINIKLYAQITDEEGTATFIGIDAIKDSPCVSAYSVNEFIANDGLLGSISIYYQSNLQDQSFNRYYLDLSFGKIYSDKKIFLHPFWNIGIGVKFDEYERKNKKWYEFKSCKKFSVGPSVEGGLLKSYSFAPKKAELAILLMFGSYICKDDIILMPSVNLGFSYTINL